jgi:hypothetical protein
MDINTDAATQDMDVRFAALKLIELLCKEGSISEEVCQSVLREQGDIVDGVSFA